MQQANDDFGFEVNDIPLMVEAIPVSPETIVLVITKVENPSETEEHLSKFFSKEMKDGILSRLEDSDMDLQISKNLMMTWKILTLPLMTRKMTTMIHCCIAFIYSTV